MTQTQFYSQSISLADATGNNYEFLSVNTSHEFDTDVTNAQVAIKGFDLVYLGTTPHYLRECGAKVTNVQINGNKVECTVGAKLHDGAPDGNYINKSASSVDIVYMAVCN